MKVRLDFVSNSSSQSFIMLGIDISKISKTKLKQKLVDKYGLPSWAVSLDDDVSIADIVENSEGLGEADEGKYFGYRLASIDNYSMNDFSLTLKELENCATKLKEIFSELGIPEAEIRLIGGTEAC